MGSSEQLAANGTQDHLDCAKISERLAANVFRTIHNGLGEDERSEDEDGQKPSAGQQLR